MWNKSSTRSAFGQCSATLEPIHLAPSPVTIPIDARGDPSGDVAGGAPCDMQKAGHGLLVGDRHQPRALGFEVVGEPASRLRPRHPRDHHPVHTAFHAWSRTDELDPVAAEVLCRQRLSPPPSSYFGHLRPQREQRNAAFLHLTRATRTGASCSGESSNDTSSTIIHALDVEQPFEYLLHKAFSVVLFLVEKQTYRKRPSRQGTQRFSNEPPPTKTTQEPYIACVQNKPLSANHFPGKKTGDHVLPCPLHSPI